MTLKEETNWQDLVNAFVVIWLSEVDGATLASALVNGSHHVVNKLGITGKSNIVINPV